MVKNRYYKTGETYRLILMDVYMPICDGYKSVQLIRNFFRQKYE